MKSFLFTIIVSFLGLNMLFAQPSADDLFDDMISTMVELDQKVEITSNITFYDNTQEQRLYTYTLKSDKFCVEQSAGITIIDPDSVLMISEADKIIVLQRNTNVGSLADRMAPFKDNLVKGIKSMKGLESRSAEVTTLSDGNYQLSMTIDDGLGPFSSALLTISSSSGRLLHATYTYSQGQYSESFGGKEPQMIEYLYSYTAVSVNETCSINRYITVSGGSSVLTAGYSTYTLHNLMGGQ